jgi:hypothetical protein
MSKPPKPLLALALLLHLTSQFSILGWNPITTLQNFLPGIPSAPAPIPAPPKDIPTDYEAAPTIHTKEKIPLTSPNPNPRTLPKNLPIKAPPKIIAKPIVVHKQFFVPSPHERAKPFLL